MGDEDFRIREKAFVAIQGLGYSALVGLKQAEGDADTEVKRRALELRQHIEAKTDPAIQTAVARLVGKAKPAGAAEVLLNYLPFAADHGVIDEICKSLGQVAVRGGKVESPVLQAVKDTRPVKRGAAAEALARAKVKDQLPVVRELLKDKDPSVRLRVALALVPYRDKEVVPVLIDAMGHLPPEQLWPAEEVLVRLAGDKAPAVSLGTNEPSRQACQKAWTEWFTTHKDKIELAKLDSPQALLGYTLVVQQMLNVGVKRTGGRVAEFDTNKKQRWGFDIQTYPVDAQVVGQDRVLLAEYQGGRVSERDFKGNVQWEVQVGGNPIGVQKLANGNVFVVMQNRLVEYDRNKKEVFTLQRQNFDIFRAHKHRNGEIVYITNNGNNGVLVRVDANQKEKKSFAVGQFGSLFGSIDVLPNGHVLVPLFQEHRVVEYDADGKQVAQITGVQLPTGVQRLPNGNTIITSLNTRRVVEFDRNGREVWNFNQANGQIFNAHRR
jgi:hypothetical protein